MEIPQHTNIYKQYIYIVDSKTNEDIPSYVSMILGGRFQLMKLQGCNTERKEGCLI